MPQSINDTTLCHDTTYNVTQSLCIIYSGKFDYHVQAQKSYIIVKEKYQDKAKQIFQDSKITITTERHRHLESIIGSKTVKESYIKELVSKWCEELTKLSEIAKTQPQAAYAAFTSGYKHKLSHFMTLCEQLIASATSCPQQKRKLKKN